MKKLIFIVILSMPILLSAQKGTYILKGKIGNYDTPARVYLISNVNKPIFDSVHMVNGQFEFKGTVDYPIPATLYINYQRASIVGKSVQRCYIYLEPGTITINSADSLSKAKISGPAINISNEKLKLALKPSETKLASLMAEFNAIRAKQKNEDVMIELEKRFKAVIEERKQPLVAFIKANPNSLISLDALKRLGGATPDYKIVAPLFKSLSTNVKKSIPGQKYAEDLDKMNAVDIGKTAPDFTQKNPEGKQITLSSFRGKYLLIDFWASWCGPCRAENPHLVKAYTKYHSKGFEILGVSLDKGKEEWIAAIKKDGLSWTQVSDLKYWNNEAAQLYCIKAVPQSFLIDPRGKIIAKNLRGQALDKKLESIFK